MQPRHQPNIGRHPPDRLKICCRRLAGSVYKLSKAMTKTAVGPLPNFGGILYPPEQAINLCAKDDNRKSDASALPKQEGRIKKADKTFIFKAPARPPRAAGTIKEKSRASLEGYVPEKRILSDNLKAAKSRLTDLDIVLEMTEFVNDHLLMQPGVIKLVQKRMNLPLIGMALVFQN